MAKGRPANASKGKGQQPERSPLHETKSASRKAGASALKLGRKQVSQGPSTSHTFTLGGTGPPPAETYDAAAARTHSRSSGKPLTSLCVDKIVKLEVDVVSNDQRSPVQPQAFRASSTGPPGGLIPFTVGSRVQLSGTLEFCWLVLRN
jgi:hypothetical protein